MHLETLFQVGICRFVPWHKSAKEPRSAQKQVHFAGPAPCGDKILLQTVSHWACTDWGPTVVSPLLGQTWHDCSVEDVSPLLHGWLLKLQLRCVLARHRTYSRILALWLPLMVQWDQPACWPMGLLSALNCFGPQCVQISPVEQNAKEETSGVMRMGWPARDKIAFHSYCFILERVLVRLEERAQNSTLRLEPPAETALWALHSSSRNSCHKSDCSSTQRDWYPAFWDETGASDGLIPKALEVVWLPKWTWVRLWRSNFLKIKARKERCT